MAVTDLILVRHGESTGNVAREAAQRQGSEVIEIGLRDADVPLSPLGTAQANGLGHWLAGLPEQQRPQAVWSSPYLRARQTAQTAVDLAGLRLSTTLDERLRDRELGILDLLTSAGVWARFPAEAQRRRWLGKFYYRPPGGESWADVALRLRSATRDLGSPDVPERVLIVAHDAVIMVLCYIYQQLDETTILTIARQQTLANASITRLTCQDPRAPWTLAAFNDVAHLAAIGAPITEHPAERDVLPG